MSDLELIVKRINELDHEISVRETELGILRNELREIKLKCPHPPMHMEECNSMISRCRLCGKLFDER